jgi:hypothetical protein
MKFLSFFTERELERIKQQLIVKERELADAVAALEAAYQDLSVKMTEAEQVRYARARVCVCVRLMCNAIRFRRLLR